MAKKPSQGAFYLYRDEIFKVITVSSGTDEVILESVRSKTQYSVRYATFQTAYEEVFKVGVVADWLNRSSRSIYRYEKRGLVNKPKMYLTAGDRPVRFYRLSDVYEMHEMISQLHQGRPRHDGRIVNNTMPDIGSLKIKLKELYGR